MLATRSSTRVKLRDRIGSARCLLSLLQTEHGSLEFAAGSVRFAAMSGAKESQKWRQSPPVAAVDRPRQRPRRFAVIRRRVTGLPRRGGKGRPDARAPNTIRINRERVRVLAALARPPAPCRDCGCRLRQSHLASAASR